MILYDFEIRVENSYPVIYKDGVLVDNETYFDYGLNAYDAMGEMTFVFTHQNANGDSVDTKIIASSSNGICITELVGGGA